MEDEKESTQKQGQEVISFRKSRLMVGIMGLVFPLILILGSFHTSTHSFEVLSSISAYYHETSWLGDIFVGILFIIGAFLITYFGYDYRDTLSSNVAGISALGIALFPSAKGGHIADIHLFFCQCIFPFACLYFFRYFYASLKVYNPQKAHKEYNLQDLRYHYPNHACTECPYY